MKTKLFGFSLLELLIALTIMAILAAISIPIYSSHLIKARRANAGIALTDIASQLEHSHLLHNSYQGAAIDYSKLTPLINGHYRIEIEIINADNYSIHAVPINAQSKDSECGSLILQANGKKEITGNGIVNSCW